MYCVCVCVLAYAVCIYQLFTLKKFVLWQQTVDEKNDTCRVVMGQKGAEMNMMHL